jgi:hypothetical protein
MKLFCVGLLGALLMTSLAAVAEETRVAVNVMKQQVQTRERVEPKRRAAPQRMQRRTSRPPKHDTSLDWPQLG